MNVKDVFHTIPSILKKGFAQAAQEDGCYQKKELKKCYLFALKTISLGQIPKYMYVRKEESKLDYTIQFIEVENPKDILVAIHSTKCKECKKADKTCEKSFIMDGTTKKVVKSLGFFYKRPKLGVLRLAKATLLKNKLTPRNILEFKREIEISKEFSGQRGIFDVYGSAIPYPVKDSNAQLQQAMVMSRGVGDLFEIIISNKAKLNDFSCIYDILHALKLLHDKGLVHRDIKAENILLFVNKEGKAELKLCDFQSVKEINKSSLLRGFTLLYSPPEDLMLLVLDELLKNINRHQNEEPQSSDDKEEIESLLRDRDAIQREHEKLKNLKSEHPFSSDIFSMGIVLHEIYFGYSPDFIFQDPCVETPQSKTDDDLLDSDRHRADLALWLKKLESRPFKDPVDEQMMSLIRSMCAVDRAKRPPIDKVLKDFQHIFGSKSLS